MARTISTQVRFTFDRKTGSSDAWEPAVYRPLFEDAPLVASIDSIAPLPSAIYNGLLSLDRHMRLALYSSMPNRTHLTDEHKEALIFTSDFYRQNPI